MKTTYPDTDLVETNKNAKADSVASGDRKRISVVAILSSYKVEYKERKESPTLSVEEEERCAAWLESHLLEGVPRTGEAAKVANDVVGEDVASAMDAG